MCVVTVERGGHIVASTSYRDPSDTCGVLGRVFDVRTVQCSAVYSDPINLHDPASIPFAIVYNDAMAVGLFISEAAPE